MRLVEVRVYPTKASDYWEEVDRISVVIQGLLDYA
jgi:hypothetical protein